MFIFSDTFAAALPSSAPSGPASGAPMAISRPSGTSHSSGLLSDDMLSKHFLMFSEEPWSDTRFCGCFWPGSFGMEPLSVLTGISTIVVLPSGVFTSTGMVMLVPGFTSAGGVMVRLPVLGLTSTFQPSGIFGLSGIFHSPEPFGGGTSVFWPG